MKRACVVLVVLMISGLLFLVTAPPKPAIRSAWAQTTIDPFEDHCWKDVMSPEVLEIYKAYKRELYIGRKPALLAIDLYRKVFDGGSRPVHELVKQYPSSCGVYAWNAVKPIQELIALARANKFPIFYTTNESRKEVNPAAVSATQRQVDSKGARDLEIMDEFQPQPKDVVIYKERASGFFGSPLIAHLTKANVDTLIVCGETTSGCVRASVADGYSYGFHMVVVEDCCFDRSLLNHQINLFDMHHKYADVMTLEQVKQHLEKRKQKD